MISKKAIKAVGKEKNFKTAVERFIELQDAIARNLGFKEVQKAVEKYFALKAKYFIAMFSNWLKENDRGENVLLYERYDSWCQYHDIIGEYFRLKGWKEVTYYRCGNDYVLKLIRN